MIICLHENKYQFVRIKQTVLLGLLFSYQLIPIRARRIFSSNANYHHKQIHECEIFQSVYTSIVVDYSRTFFHWYEISL